MLTWEWKHKIGKLILEDNTEINIYKGNALAIFIWENEDEYQMYTFFCDKDHLKNCLKEFNPFQNWKTVMFWEVPKDVWNLVKALQEKEIEIIIGRKQG